MKLAVVILACVAAASAQFNNSPYRSGISGQYNGQFNGQYNRNQYRYNPYSTPAPFQYRTSVAPVVTPAPVFVASTRASVPVPIPGARYSADARNAQTVKEANEINPDGSFNYFFETDNGIAAQAQGVPRDFGGNPPVAPVVQQGGFSWTSPDGTPIQISYVADENGYQPSGNALPTPPPIPEAIARALEYIARSAPRQ